MNIQEKYRLFTDYAKYRCYTVELDHSTRSHVLTREGGSKRVSNRDIVACENKQEIYSLVESVT